MLERFSGFPVLQVKVCERCENDDSEGNCDRYADLQGRVW